MADAAIVIGAGVIGSKIGDRATRWRAKFCRFFFDLEKYQRASAPNSRMHK